MVPCSCKADLYREVSKMKLAIVVALFMTTVITRPCISFQHAAEKRTIYRPRMSSDPKANNPSDDDNLQLDPKVASDFTIQVCTSTNCLRRLQSMGLDQYHVLEELYERAESQNVETHIIIEDGPCQGGKNCKLGPCVAVLHDDFYGNVALEGMDGVEFRERVFHK
eukprot:CCRYP_017209-RA/>CCRYP_017209-RA protein AED:0.13 eAED:0.13 QI:166/1/1/1/0.5/0.33/3/794/165